MFVYLTLLLHELLCNNRSYGTFFIIFYNNCNLENKTQQFQPQFYNLQCPFKLVDVLVFPNTTHRESGKFAGSTHSRPIT